MESGSPTRVQWRGTQPQGYDDVEDNDDGDMVDREPDPGRGERTVEGDRMKRTEFLPWEYDPASAEREEQARVRHELLEAGAALGEGVYVAPSAAVFCDRLALGDRSYVAAGAYLTGELVIGADCSVNPYAVVRGEVRLGDGVRIGAHSSILGFNHFMATDRPIHQQGVFSKGIVVGDDVWIGSSATILDGVRVGSHVVIAAGAIVTKDVEDWAVVAGNPARQLRSRRPDEAPGDALGAEALDDEVLASRLAAFSATVRAQIDDVLARSLDDGAFVDRPSALVGRAAPAIRPWCDAVELSFLVHGRPPLGLDADELATGCRGSRMRRAAWCSRAAPYTAASTAGSTPPRPSPCSATRPATTC
jgi:acetyltransferase-like isoleucine patch superfamily enzyme